MHVEYFTFGLDTNRDEVFLDMSERFGSRFRERGIRWLDEESILGDQRSAEKRIEVIDAGHGDNIAVRYVETKKPLDEEMKRLNHEVVEAGLKYFDLNDRVRARVSGESYVECTRCKSKIASGCIKTNRCPVCGHDMRTKEELEEIEAANLVWRIKRNVAEMYVKEHGEKTVMWLVKINCED